VPGVGYQGLGAEDCRPPLRLFDFTPWRERLLLVPGFFPFLNGGLAEDGLDLGLHNSAALHDVIETKWVSVYSQNVSTLYPMQKQRVSTKAGNREEKSDTALHDVLETKWVSVYSQNVSTLYLVQKQRVSIKAGNPEEESDTALQDVIETKWASSESRKSRKNLSY